MQDAQSKLGKRIVVLRKKRGWSQEEFAEKSKLARSFAGAIERGEKDVRLSTLSKIAAAFETDLGSLLKGM
jgi:transcriptional regulator with XRE-family HTH domain